MRPTQPLSIAEFIILLGLMISIVALAIDIMLPALAVIGTDLGAGHVNDTQLIVTMMFAGFTIGQFFVGPLSDAYGRKPVIYIGYLIFFVGCLISIYAQDMTTMYIGRFMQGIGAAAPRVISSSLVRDLYSGHHMARIMSYIMTAFIFVPIVSPLLGQLIILSFPWQWLFWTIMGLGMVAAVWLALRQPETLPQEQRIPFTFAAVWGNLLIILRNPSVMGYTITFGVISGAFIAYLSASRQIFQDIYHTGELFALYFSICALAIGAASLLNAKLVMIYQMQKIVQVSFWWMTIISLAAFFLFMQSGGIPHLWMFVAWVMMVFFGMGLAYANLTSIAMEPLGDIAGIGAAVIGSLGTLLSLPLSYMIGRMIDGTVLPFVGAYSVLGAVCLVIIYRTDAMVKAKAKADV